MGALINAEDIREGDYVIMRRKKEYVYKRQASYKTRVVRIWDLRESEIFPKCIRITGERNTPKRFLSYSNSMMWEYETLNPWEYWGIKKADWQKWVNNQ
jgi:hypothetical protein